MADLMHVQLRTEPWSPAWDAKVIEVFHRYDVPLIGLVAQHGSHYLFYCLAGAGRQGSVWAYAHLAEYEVLNLQEAEGAEFDRMLAALLLHRNLRVVFATEDHGIVVTAEVAPSNTMEHLLNSTLQALEAEIVELQRDFQETERAVGLSRSD